MGGVAWTMVDSYILGARELGPFPGREHRGPTQALKPRAVFFRGSWLRESWLLASLVHGTRGVALCGTG